MKTLISRSWGKLPTTTVSYIKIPVYSNFFSLFFSRHTVLPRRHGCAQRLPPLPVPASPSPAGPARTPLPLLRHAPPSPSPAMPPLSLRGRPSSSICLRPARVAPMPARGRWNCTRGYTWPAVAMVVAAPGWGRTHRGRA